MSCVTAPSKKDGFAGPLREAATVVPSLAVGVPSAVASTVVEQASVTLVTTFAGQEIVGGAASTTVTLKEHPPPPDEEETVTGVVPTGKKEPEAGLAVRLPLQEWFPPARR